MNSPNRSPLLRVGAGIALVLLAAGVAFAANWTLLDSGVDDDGPGRLDAVGGAASTATERPTRPRSTTAAGGVSVTGERSAGTTTPKGGSSAGTTSTTGPTTTRSASTATTGARSSTTESRSNADASRSSGSDSDRDDEPDESDDHDESDEHDEHDESDEHDDD